MERRFREISAAEATEATAALFDDIRRVLRVPFVNLVYGVWAAEGKALHTLWGGGRPNLTTVDFEIKADSLRSEAVERVLNDATVPSLAPRLNLLNVGGPEGLEQLRRELDVFHYVNPKLLLHCALLKKALQSGYSGTGTPLGFIEPGIAPGMPDQVVMLDPDTAPPDARAMMLTIQERLDLPCINSDYRALGKWPAFLRGAWSDLDPYLSSSYYEEHAAHLEEYAKELVSGLPYAAIVSDTEVRQSGVSKKRLAELVEMFLSTLPGLILNIAFWKIALDGGECAKRSPFPVAMVETR